MDEAIKAVLESLECPVSVTSFENGEIEALEISKGRFGSLHKRDRSIVFVDGGNQPIFVSPGIAFYYNRVASVAGSANQVQDFFSLIHARKAEDKIHFFSETYPPSFKYSIDSMDRSIATASRASISSVADIVRRYSELNMATSVKGKEVLIVLDGALEAKFPGERDAIRQLVDNHTVCALSKTNTLLSESGESVSAMLDRISPGGAWYCQVGQSGEIGTYMVKLHAKSKYIFRAETKEDPDEVFGALLPQSADPIFLGYPYGLIKADRLARVTNEEIEMQRMKFLAKVGKDYERLIPYLNALNAHSILDNIR